MNFTVFHGCIWGSERSHILVFVRSRLVLSIFDNRQLEQMVRQLNAWFALGRGIKLFTLITVMCEVTRSLGFDLLVYITISLIQYLIIIVIIQELLLKQLKVLLPGQSVSF